MSIKIVLVCVLLVVISFFCGYWIGGHKQTTTVKSDTLRVYIPKEINKTVTLTKLKPTHSFITIKTTDTLFIKDSVDVASADTTITDSVSTIKLSVKYYSKPLDYFDIKTSINYKFSEERIFINNYIIPSEKWYNRFNIGAGLGLSLTNDFRVYPSISIGVYYKIW